MPRRPSRAGLVMAAMVLLAGIGLLLVLRGARVAASDGPPQGLTTEARGLRADIDAKLAAVGREVERLAAAGDAAGSGKLAAELARVRRGEAGGEGSELHVVGIASGESPMVQTGFGTAPAIPPPPAPTPPGRAVIDLRVADRPVVLALSAGKPVNWELRLAPGVRLEKVLLGGVAGQRVEPLPPGAAVEDHTGAGRPADELFCFNRRLKTFRQMAQALRRLTGLPVATFLGSGMPHGRLVVGPGNPEWEAQRLLRDVNPLHARATDRRRAMMITDHGQKRYFYEPDSGKWSYAPMNPRLSVASMAYAAGEDAYYALSSTRRMEDACYLVRLTADGVPEWRIPVAEVVTDDYDYQERVAPQLAAVGGLLAVVTAPLSDPVDPESPDVPRVVVIDPKENVVKYAGPLAPHGGGGPGAGTK